MMPSFFVVDLEMANMRREMDELVRKNQEEIENMNKSWEDRLAESQQESVRIPHFCYFLNLKSYRKYLSTDS